MPAAALAVSGKGGPREFPLEPKGVLLGRSSKCDVVLDSHLVSRQHARVFQDPFGRWIIEDLGSRTGVRVGGQRVRAHAMVPGERVVVGPFVLVLAQAFEEALVQDSKPSTSTCFVEPVQDLEVARTGVKPDAILSRDRLHELNRIADRLEAAASLSDLYTEICRYLTSTKGSAAVVVRLPAAGQPLPEAIQTLASDASGGGLEAAPASPAENLYLSKRVLEAVRASGQPVLATSVHAGDGQLSLTLMDTRQPRAVVCAPLGEAAGPIDALYLDLPLRAAAPDLLEFMQALARQVRMVRRNLQQLEAKAERRVLDYQLSLARQIQSGLTPRAIADIPGVDIAIFYEPALWVGGDYCDLWRLPDGRVTFAVGDVCGKGLPAAMVMSNLHAALRVATLFCPGPALAMEHVNRHVGQHVPEGMFITLFLGVLDAKSGRLEYVNAGHIPPLLVRPGAGVTSLGQPANGVLGLWQGSFTAEATQLEAGTGLLVVTDGLTEAADAKGDLFGLKRVQAVLESAPIRSAQQMVQMATEGAATFCGLRPRQDDMTALALLWRGVSP